MKINNKIVSVLLFILVLFLIICFVINNNKLSDTNNQLDKFRMQIEIIKDELDIRTEQLDKTIATINDLKSDEYELIYIGDFKLTHYCCEEYKHICGTGYGITATGTKVTAGRSVAVDPKMIPYGSKIYIEGYGWRIAEDCGGAVKNKHIDIAVATHSEALSMGTTSGGVWLLIKK
jgi:3D (Asp-Asp-Asp) domain-containing protein